MEVTWANERQSHSLKISFLREQGPIRHTCKTDGQGAEVVSKKKKEKEE